MSIITGYKSHFEVHVTSQHSHYKRSSVHTCLLFYLAVTVVHVMSFKMTDSNNGNNCDCTAKVFKEIRDSVSFQ